VSYSIRQSKRVAESDRPSESLSGRASDSLWYGDLDAIMLRPGQLAWGDGGGVRSAQGRPV